MTNVEPLYDGDLRVDSLLNELENVIDQARDRNLTAATIVGVIEVMKHRLLMELG